MKPPHRIAGIILAGGRSSRMNGRDKATLPLAGRTLLERAIHRLQPQVAMLAVNSNADPRSLPASNLAVIPDSLPGFLGPLAGILAGMEWAQGQGAHYIATAACDTPFFPTTLVDELGAVLTPSGVALASSGGMAHPVFALWPVRLAQDLRAYLDSGARRSVLSYAERHSCVQAVFQTIQLEGEVVDPFFNINTPEDLAEAERLAHKFASMKHRVFGITGWKNSGKTTLAERLVAELTRRGWKVSTIKHAHHAFDIDKEGTDSFRHRQAGASEVAIVSANRWALMHELRGEAEPDLAAILEKLAPCDLVLIEGYKREPHPKIEVRRLEAKDRTPLAPADPAIVAVAADHAVEADGLPSFAIDDVPAIADFIEEHAGLRSRT